MNFVERFNGSFFGILKWDDLAPFWNSVLAQPDGWYLYDTEKEPPTVPASAESLTAFIKMADELIRSLHKCPACGIVFTDDRTVPTFVKIYHPRKLGSTCGDSGEVTLPAWVITRITPTALPQAKKAKPSRLASFLRG